MCPTQNKGRVQIRRHLLHFTNYRRKQPGEEAKKGCKTRQSNNRPGERHSKVGMYFLEEQSIYVNQRMDLRRTRIPSSDQNWDLEEPLDQFVILKKEFIVDSIVSMHMISKVDLTPEQGTITVSKKPNNSYGLLDDTHDRAGDRVRKRFGHVRYCPTQQRLSSRMISWKIFGVHEYSYEWRQSQSPKIDERWQQYDLQIGQFRLNCRTILQRHLLRSLDPPKEQEKNTTYSSTFRRIQIVKSAGARKLREHLAEKMPNTRMATYRALQNPVI